MMKIYDEEALDVHDENESPNKSENTKMRIVWSDLS